MRPPAVGPHYLGEHPTHPECKVVRRNKIMLRPVLYTEILIS